MASTRSRIRKHTPCVAGRKRAPRGPDDPHDVLLKGLTDRDIDALDAIVARLNVEGRATGARYTRTALLIAWIRERIAAESAKGGDR